MGGVVRKFEFTLIGMIVHSSQSFDVSSGLSVSCNKVKQRTGMSGVFN